MKGKLNTKTLRCTKVFLILVSFFCCYETINAQTSLNQNKEDSLNRSLILIKEYKIGKQEFFKTNNENNEAYPSYVYLKNDELFLLNDQEKKVIIHNLKTNTTSTIDKLNKIVDQYEKKYFGLMEVFAKDSLIYVGFTRRIVGFDRFGNIIRDIPLEFNLGYFNVAKDNNILFVDRAGLGSYVFNNDNMFIELSKEKENGISYYSHNDTIFTSFGTDILSFSLNQYSGNFSRPD
ncbi:MAG: hypothetical protein WCL14_11060 [Bacteroidota bacterium]